MTDQNEIPIDDGDRTAGGGVIGPRTDGIQANKANDNEVRQTGMDEVVKGRFGSDVD